MQKCFFTYKTQHRFVIVCTSVFSFTVCNALPMKELSANKNAYDSFLVLHMCLHYCYFISNCKQPVT
jgi:hypothetical protein